MARMDVSRKISFRLDSSESALLAVSDAGMAFVCRAGGRQRE